MSVDITIPSPGESIAEVTVGSWMKHSGDWVEKDEIILEIESDKAKVAAAEEKVRDLGLLKRKPKKVAAAAK